MAEGGMDGLEKDLPEVEVNQASGEELSMSNGVLQNMLAIGNAISTKDRSLAGRIAAGVKKGKKRDPLGIPGQSSVEDGPENSGIPDQDETVGVPLGSSPNIIPGSDQHEASNQDLIDDEPFPSDNYDDYLQDAAGDPNTTMSSIVPTVYVSNNDLLQFLHQMEERMIQREKERVGVMRESLNLLTDSVLHIGNSVTDVANQLDQLSTKIGYVITSFETVKGNVHHQINNVYPTNPPKASGATRNDALPTAIFTQVKGAKQDILEKNLTWIFKSVSSQNLWDTNSYPEVRRAFTEPELTGFQARLKQLALPDLTLCEAQTLRGHDVGTKEGSIATRDLLLTLLIKAQETYVPVQKTVSTIINEEKEKIDPCNDRSYKSIFYRQRE